MTPDPNSPDEGRPAESNGSRRDARAQKAQGKAWPKAEADARAKAEKLQKAQAKQDAKNAKAQAKAEAAQSKQDAQEAAAQSKKAALGDKARAKAEAAEKAKAEREEKARAKAEPARKAKSKARDAEAAEEARPTKRKLRQKSDATRSAAKGRIGAAAGRKRPANGKKGPANGKKGPANGKKRPANGRKTTEKARRAAARKLHKQRRRARVGIEVDGQTVRIAEVHGDELVWVHTYDPDVSVPDALENWKSGQKRARSSTVTVTWAGPRSYLRRLDKPQVPAKALKQFRSGLTPRLKPAATTASRSSSSWWSCS